MRAAAYIRLSELTDSTTSPERQRADIAKYIEANGWDHDPDVDRYEDIDVSAYQARVRPAYDQLMGRLDTYDVLVCWKLDRLLRSVRRDLGPLLERLDQHAVRLLSVNEGLDNTTPGGEFVITVMAALAQSESATQGLRIRSAQEHMARTGRFHGGKVPYGWMTAPHPDGGTQLIADPVESEVVRRIVRLMLAGTSGRGVADLLNREQVPTREGKVWSQRQVYNMARHPGLAGWSTYRGQIVRDAHGDPVPGREPLVDEETWLRLQKALDGVAFDRTRRSGATLLSGLVKCGRCGHPMSGWTGSRRASYSCTRKTMSGPSVCPGLSILCRWVDRYVTRQTLVRLERTELPQPTPISTPSPDREAQLLTQLRRLERDRIELGLYDDDESEQVYRARWFDLRRQIQEVRQSSQASKARSARPTLTDVGPRQDVAAAWATMDGDARRAVIRAVVDTVTIMPYTVRGQWEPGRVVIDWLD